MNKKLLIIAVCIVSGLRAAHCTIPADAYEWGSSVGVLPRQTNSSALKLSDAEIAAKVAELERLDVPQVVPISLSRSATTSGPAMFASEGASASALLGKTADEESDLSESSRRALADMTATIERHEAAGTLEQLKANLNAVAKKLELEESQASSGPGAASTADTERNLLRLVEGEDSLATAPAIGTGVAILGDLPKKRLPLSPRTKTLLQIEKELETMSTDSRPISSYQSQILLSISSAVTALQNTLSSEQ